MELLTVLANNSYEMAYTHISQIQVFPLYKKQLQDL